jgi:hypothetical protein
MAGTKNIIRLGIDSSVALLLSWRAV